MAFSAASLHASARLCSEFAGRFCPAAFGRKLPYIVRNNDRALELLLLSRLAAIFFHGKIDAHAPLEALDVVGGNLERSQQIFRRGAVRGLHALNLAATQRKRDIAYAADGRSVNRHQGHALPDDATVPVYAHATAGCGARHVALILHDNAAVNQIETVKCDEQVFAMKHPQQVGTLHHETDAALFARMKHA